MKKALVIFFTLLIGVSVKATDLHRIITFEELPVKSQEFVTTYFSAQSIRFIRMEIDVTNTEYTVRFENGMEIEFNSTGDWEEVESHSACLPMGFLPASILDYLNRHHPGVCLHEISRGRHKYEIEMSNGIELIFNKNGEFLRYDDQPVQYQYQQH